LLLLPQLAVLDMAGTTVLDAGQVPRAFTKALTQHHLSFTSEQIEAVRGASKREAVLRFVPEGPHRAQQAAQVYATFCERLRALYHAEGVLPVPGAPETIAALRARGIRVALNTGFDRDITTMLLAALHWHQGTVDTVVCGDDVPHGRPAPDLIHAAMRATSIGDPQQVMNVGDTALDLQAGHAAGVRWNIGVLSGAHTRARLAAAPHTHLLASVAALPKLLFSPAAGQ